MTSSCRSGFAVLFCGLIFLAACDDPSGVGLSVTDFGETDPYAVSVEATFGVDSLHDFTGMVDTDPAALVSQAFAGRTPDPLFGTLNTSAYLKFVIPPALPSQYYQTEIDTVFLNLRVGNIYGDTLGTGTFEIYEIASSWTAERFPSDTLLDVHKQLVGQFSIAGADTLVTVELDQNWVSLRDTTLRSLHMADNFFGLEIRPVGNTPLTVGFTFFSTFTVVSDYLGLGIPLHTDYATTNLASISSLDTSGSSAPDYLIPLRDGTGLGLSLDFDLSEYRGQPISAAYLRLDADTLLLRDAVPSSFLRPLANTLVLYRIENGRETPFLQGFYQRERQAYFFSGPGFTSVIQDLLLDRSTIDSFKISFPFIPQTLHYAPVTAHEGTRPRLVLLLVPDGQ